MNNWDYPLGSDVPEAPWNDDYLSEEEFEKLQEEKEYYYDTQYE